MFQTAIQRTGAKDDCLFHFLVAVGTGKAESQLRWTGARPITDAEAHQQALKHELAHYDRIFAALFSALQREEMPQPPERSSACTHSQGKQNEM